MKERLLFGFFLISLAVLSYTWGTATAHFKFFPYPEVGQAVREVGDFIRHWRNDLELEPTRYLVAAREVGVQNPDKAMPGLRVVAGYFHDRPTTNGAILLDEQGRELHFWPIDRQTIAAQVEGAFSNNRHPFLHGFEVLPDGSVVVNFGDSRVLARLDACGRIVWAIKGGYHHAVDLARDGTLWAVGGPGSNLNPTSISRIDPDQGTVLWAIHFDDELLARMGKGVFFIRREDDEFEPSWLVDPFHLNDVEILEENMAEAFPGFEAGDIMLSLRSLNLVVVIDAENFDPKWWQHGPWHRQHDPDFLPNGRISVFDNDMNGHASRIIEIDPVTRETNVVFEGSRQLPFYTWIKGKHQHLDNGNILITEPQAGRVFEVDRRGNLVWQYQNRFDAKRNLLVGNALWLPLDYFEPNAPQCQASAQAHPRHPLPKAPTPRA